MDQIALLVLVLGTGIVAVLFVHELGHLLVARHYGMNVLSLSVGFGPALMNFTDHLGTAWKLKAFPLGGSCVIDYKVESIAAEQPADRLALQFLRERAAIHAAGPVF